MAKRKIKQWHECTAKPENGGGETYAEQTGSMTIDKMYGRMMAMGEIQDAMARKNTHGDKKAAVALMGKAKVAPQYMKDGERFAELDKMHKVQEGLKAEAEAEAENAKIEAEIERRRQAEA